MRAKKWYSTRYWWRINDTYIRTRTHALVCHSNKEHADWEAWRKRTTGSYVSNKQKRGKNMNSTNFLHANERQTKSRWKKAGKNTRAHPSHRQLQIYIHMHASEHNRHNIAGSSSEKSERAGKTKHSIRTNTHCESIGLVNGLPLYVLR